MRGRGDTDWILVEDGGLELCERGGEVVAEVAGHARRRTERCPVAPLLASVLALVPVRDYMPPRLLQVTAERDALSQLCSPGARCVARSLAEPCLNHAYEAVALEARLDGVVIRRAAPPRPLGSLSWQSLDARCHRCCPPRRPWCRRRPRWRRTRVRRRLRPTHQSPRAAAVLSPALRPLRVAHRYRS